MAFFLQFLRQTTAEVGRKGEEIAAEYLYLLGYRVLGANIRLGKDEIDLLALDPVDDVLVFVEVKSRSVLKEDFHPDLNLTQQKRSNMVRAARRWIDKHDDERGYRLDLICIAEGAVVDHYREIQTDSLL